MNRMIVVAALGFSTAIGAALAAKSAIAEPMPMPRPAASDTAFEDGVTGIESRLILVSAVDPAAPRSVGYGVNDAQRVVFPVYFAEGRVNPGAEARVALRALAEEITYRGLTDIRVTPSTAALMSADMQTQREAEQRAVAVAETLKANGVPDRWIAVQPGRASDV